MSKAMAAGKDEPKATGTSAGGFKLWQELPLKRRSLLLLHNFWVSAKVAGS